MASFLVMIGFFAILFAPCIVAYRVDLRGDTGDRGDRHF
jgi:hypothetical protein